MGRMPFLGIVLSRPYPKTGMTTDRWKREIPPRTVHFGHLWLQQEHLKIQGLFGIPHIGAADDVFPHAVQWHGAFYLEDGHHRVVMRALEGGERMVMRVFTDWA